MELLPLPSPSTADWLYAEHSRLPWLRSRLAYKKYLLERRSEQISGLIRKHRPRAVIFYGLKYYDDWVDIAEEAGAGRFRKASREKVSVARSSNTLLCIVQHPVAYGLKADYFLKVGNFLERSLR